MNALLTALTVISIAICGPTKTTLNEELSIKKSTNTIKEPEVTYKKVPTKWVKITKKSN